MKTLFIIAIANLSVILTVTARNIEKQEAELIFNIMWQEKPSVVESFSFDEEKIEFRAKLKDL